MRRITRWGAAAGAALVLSMGSGITTGVDVALAEPPRHLAERLTDAADALTPTQESEVTAALAQLAAERQIDLHIVFVDSFDQRPGPQWAIDTFSASGLGQGDAVFAVAVQDRVYGYHEDTSVETDWASAIATQHAEPHLRDDEWAAAALAVADGYGSDSEAFPWRMIGSVWGVVLAGFGAFWAYVSRWDRRKRREKEQDLLESRGVLARRVVELEELVGKAEAEADYAAADLGPTEEARLREVAQETRDVIGATASTLEHTPAEPGRKPPRPKELDAMRKRVSRYDGRTRTALDAITAAVRRVADARDLLENPADLDALAHRVEDLGSRIADTRGLVQASMAEHPGWLVEELHQHLERAQTHAAGAGAHARNARTLLEKNRPGDAGARRHEARDEFRQAEELLAAVADPGELAEQLIAELEPLREDLTDLVERAAKEQKHHDRYARWAKKTAHAKDWADRGPEVLDQSLAEARQVLTEQPGIDVSPEERRKRLDTAERRLSAATAPYFSVAKLMSASSSSSRSSSSSFSSSSSSSSSSGGGRF